MKNIFINKTSDLKYYIVYLNGVVLHKISKSNSIDVIVNYFKSLGANVSVE